MCDASKNQRIWMDEMPVIGGQTASPANPEIITCGNQIVVGSFAIVSLDSAFTGG